VPGVAKLGSISGSYSSSMTGRPFTGSGIRSGQQAQHGSGSVADRDGVLAVGRGIALLDAGADDAQAFGERVEFVLGYRLQVLFVLFDAPLFPFVLFGRSEDGGHFGGQLAGCAVELGHHALHVLALREIWRYLAHAAQALHGFALVVVAILVTVADGLELHGLRSLLLVGCVCVELYAKARKSATIRLWSVGIYILTESQRRGETRQVDGQPLCCCVGMYIYL